MSSQTDYAGLPQKLNRAGAVEKEQHRTKRREEEAEAWATARIQFQNLGPAPSNRAGASCLSKYYPALVGPPDDASMTPTQPTKYSIKEARCPASKCTINKLRSSTQQAATDATANLLELLKSENDQHLHDTDVKSFKAAKLLEVDEHEPGCMPTSSGLDQQSVSAARHFKLVYVPVEESPTVNQHTYNGDLSNSELRSEKMTSMIEVGQNNGCTENGVSGRIVLTASNDIAAGQGEPTGFKTPKARKTIDSTTSTRSDQTIKPKRSTTDPLQLESLHQSAQIQSFHATQLMQLYVDRMNSIDEGIQISDAESLELLADTERLLRAFSLVFGPQRCPKSVTKEGLVYRVIPPPGINGPKRFSMSYTKIWASRLVLASDQPNGMIHAGCSASKGVMYFDGIYRTARGNPWGRNDIETAAESTSEISSGYVEPRNNTNRESSAKLEDDLESKPRRALAASPFHVTSERLPAPVHIAATTENRKYMSAPEDPEIQKARGILAMEVARLSLRATSTQLLDYMAIPIPAINSKNVDVKVMSETSRRRKNLSRSKFFPSLIADVDAEAELVVPGHKVQTRTILKHSTNSPLEPHTSKQKIVSHTNWGQVVDYRVAPGVLKLNNESYDVDELARNACVPCFTTEHNSKHHSFQQTPQKPSSQDVAVSKNLVVPAPKQFHTHQRTPLHRRALAQSHIGNLFIGELQTLPIEKQEDLIDLSPDSAAPLAQPIPRLHGVPNFALNDLGPVAYEHGQSRAAPTGSFSMRGAEQRRPIRPPATQIPLPANCFAANCEHQSQPQLPLPIPQSHLSIQYPSPIRWQQHQSPAYFNFQDNPYNSQCGFSQSHFKFQVPIHQSPWNYQSTMTAGSPFASNAFTSFPNFHNNSNHNRYHHHYHHHAHEPSLPSISSFGQPPHCFIDNTYSHNHFTSPSYSLTSGARVQGPAIDGIASMTPAYHRQRILQERKEAAAAAAAASLADGTKK